MDCAIGSPLFVDEEVVVDARAGVTLPARCRRSLIEVKEVEVDEGIKDDRKGCDGFSSRDRCFIFGHGLDPVKSNHLSDEYVELVSAASVNVEKLPLVTYSARGHGQSTGWQTSDDAQFLWSNLSKDMSKVAHHFGYSRFIVGGHSMGAATALYCALQNPELIDGIVLVRPPTAWETRTARKSLLLRLAASLRLKEERTQLQFQSGSPVPHAHSPCLYRVLCGAAETDLPSRDAGASRDSGIISDLSGSGISDCNVCADKNDVSGATNDTADTPNSNNNINKPKDSITDLSWSSIRCPVLILAFKHDDAHPVSTAEHLYCLLPHAELHVMEDEAEAKDRWGGIIENFLSRVCAR